MNELKLKVWKGEPYQQAAIKLDGIQARLYGTQVVSRAGKALYNVDPSLLEQGKIYEVFLGSFDETVSVLRSHKHPRQVRQSEVYEIYPGTDVRLLTDMTLSEALASGCEGLVLDKKYKAKAVNTIDLHVLGVVQGQGKYAGCMGALVTKLGNVGTGFTDAERRFTWRMGDVIEVEFMEYTASGKMRHPRFIRHRWDKL